MKSATVTWITYNNYGTVLQAYALQQYLLKRGVENDIISDQYIIANKGSKNKAALKPASGPKQKNKLLYYATHPWKIFYRFYYMLQCIKSGYVQKPYAGSQRLYEEFKKNDLKILYGYQREDMSQLNAVYDLFICGSDQTWSVLDYNFDGYFYLDFVIGKKISYAASIGTLDIPKDKQTAVMEYLESFSSIAVRERQSAEQLSRWMNKPVEWVLDPTLLQEPCFWREFAKGIQTPKKKYLLCYFLETKEWYFTYAHQLAKRLGLKLVLIPSRMEFVHHKAVYNQPVGPKEFVALFRDADFVLTDSYHGSIFSIQFEKQFLHLKRFADEAINCQNIRIYSLFCALQLEELILSEREFSERDICSIDYQKINQLMSGYRKHSEEYIDQSIWE